MAQRISGFLLAVSLISWSVIIWNHFGVDNVFIGLLFLPAVVGLIVVFMIEITL
jgi:hypothetical protein